MSKQAVKRWENRIVGHGEESPENLLANPSNFRVHPKRQQDALPGALEEGMMSWKNNIVRYSEEAPDQLLANPQNWRVHPRSQQVALEELIETVGLIAPVICNETTGNVVDGHLRISLAMRRNEPTVPVAWVRLSEAEERMALATFDPISALATTDKAKLDELLADVQTGSAAVQEMLAGLAESAGLYTGEVLRYGDKDKGPTAEEYFDGFKNATIRQIVLIYPLKGSPDVAGGYEWAIALLEEICAEFGFDTNTDALTWLLGEYQEGRA